MEKFYDCYRYEKFASKTHLKFLIMLFKNSNLFYYK